MWLVGHCSTTPALWYKSKDKVHNVSIWLGLKKQFFLPVFRNGYPDAQYLRQLSQKLEDLGIK